jgi:hypothetical protein
MDAIDGDRGLRQEVEAAAFAELQNLGPKGVPRAAIVKRFQGRGVSRATLFRWVEAVIASGKVGAWLVERVRKSAKAGKAVEKGSSTAVAVRDVLPEPVTVEDLEPTGAIPIMQLMRECQAAAKKVMAYAETKDGAVRNAKLLLMASEHMRRTGETMARIQESVTDVQRLRALNAMIVDEISKESPACAQRIVRRLQSVLEVWLA